MKTFVVITAAGVGQRMGLNMPKQFYLVNNKPLLVYTLEVFERSTSIDGILVTTLSDKLDLVRGWCEKYNIRKLKWVIPGGETNADSIRRGVEELQHYIDDDDFVMIHDGDRCLITENLISNHMDIVLKEGSAVTVVPCVEAIFKRKNFYDVMDTLQEPRNELWRIQTPYTYRLKVLKWAYEKYDTSGKTISAPCLMMQELHEPVYFSKGSDDNIKITNIEDLNIFKAILSTRI